MITEISADKISRLPGIKISFNTKDVTTSIESIKAPISTVGFRIRPFIDN
jgi:hypothetical protein